MKVIHIKGSFLPVPATDPPYLYFAPHYIHSRPRKRKKKFYTGKE